MVGTSSDALRYIARLTPRKVWNAAKVYASFYWSRWTANVHHWGMPLSISVEPTTACNLGCPECPSGLRQFSRPTGNLKADFFRETIDQLAPSVTYLTFYFQGEPYINPEFLEMVKYAREKRIYTATSTNAHFLDDDNAVKTIESGLDRLIISIDGTDQQTYEQYRVNGSLDKVLEGTRNILKWKKKLKSKTPHVIFQFLVVGPNEHQVEDVAKLARELGVNEVRYKTAQIYNFEQGNPLIPENSKYSRYQKQPDGTYTIKNEMESHCWRLWQSCVITWDGKVVPCCFDKDAKHQLGDLQKQDFKTLWQSAPYNAFRKSVLTSRNDVDICNNCTEGTKVWA